MAVAKVILNDVSQIDLTSDTVTAESLLSGFTAHDASGTQITGTASDGGGGGAVKYTRYTLTGDTTIRAFIDSIGYEVVSDTCCYIAIRVSGDNAPSTGNYTVNNFRWVWTNGTRTDGRHYYKDRYAAPNTFPDLPATNERNNTAYIENGILKSNSTSSSPIGTTGDVVTLCEISGTYDNTIMNGGAI